MAFVSRAPRTRARRLSARPRRHRRRAADLSVVPPRRRRLAARGAPRGERAARPGGRREDSQAHDSGALQILAAAERRKKMRGCRLTAQLPMFSSWRPQVRDRLSVEGGPGAPARWSLSCKEDLRDFPPPPQSSSAGRRVVFAPGGAGGRADEGGGGGRGGGGPEPMLF